ncbi:MAG: LD-carboxypeptidase [Prochlorococcus sp. SP3034]|nr:LD-carboxypeptidase [Prochlorococcus sp. SP3034]|tara:strand:+ start:4552 stop:5415 length:864 start_codon:yes stop_codon:yes gene_type:complete
MFPNKLKKGDLVEIAAPSSSVEDNEAFFTGIEIIQKWGLIVNKNDILSRRFNSFAGNDHTRLKELKEVQKSKFIIFAKGGWGAARLLEDELSWGEGWMMGFSDASSLLLSKYSQGCLGSIHGPMITTLSNEPSWSIERLKNLLFEGYVDDIKGKPIKGGIATGEVIVSNLTIFTYLIGTSHLPNLKNKILVFEDINEDIYKIDRMLTYLKLSKTLDEIVGIGFGNFFNEKESDSNSELFEALIYERFKNIDIPIVSNLPIGHISGNACIPIGFNATLNGKNGILSVN